MSTQTRALALILLLGFVARLGFILVVPSVPLSDFADYDRLGWSLAEDRGYVNDSGQPTAFRAPGYPFMLSLIYRAFGHRTGIAKAVNAALGTLTCLLIFWMARLIGHEQIALLSALIYALYPSAVYYTNLLATEVPFTFLLFLAIFISLKVSTDPMGGQGRGPFVCSVLLLGAVLGSAALVKPVALSALGFLVISVVARLKPTKRALLFGFIILGTVLLFILPWSYRNYLVSKRWALVTHGGMSFYLGNNPWATGDYYVPPDNPLDGLTEWQLDDAGYRAGIEFLLRYPFKALWLFVLKCLKHFFVERDAFYWNFHTVESFSQGLHSTDLIAQRAVLIPAFLLPILSSAGIIFLGLLGLKKTYSLQERPFFLAFVALWVVGHSIFLGDDRYHFPVIPILAISTANLVVRWASVKTQGPRKIAWQLVQHVGVSDYFISSYTAALALSWAGSFLAKVGSMASMVGR